MGTKIIWKNSWRWPWPLNRVGRLIGLLLSVVCCHDMVLRHTQLASQQGVGRSLSRASTEHRAA